MSNRCPACRTRRATFTSLVAHIKSSGHKLCQCGGYHFPHRPGSKFCHKAPLVALHELQRREDHPDPEVVQDIRLEAALDNVKPPSTAPCPF